jgi:hypothetical protein
MKEKISRAKARFSVFLSSVAAGMIAGFAQSFTV